MNDRLHGRSTRRRHMARIVGIDLGTTNSLVAVVEKGHPVVLPDSDRSRLVPSVVAIGSDNRVVVGTDARAVGATDPRRMVYSVKRLMGRGLGDLGPLKDRLPFDLAGSTAETIRLTLAGRRFTPVELSSLVLKKLKAIAELNLVETIKQAVITVPAYFNDAQRQATLLAGRLAGLEVLRLVNEPTAACLAYGLDRKKNGLVAVYDLGGGTFDVSILKLQDGVFEVLATAGDTELGGDDFDRALMAHLADALKAARGIDAAQVIEAHELLRRVAEEVKRALSEGAEAIAMVDHPALGGAWSHAVSRVEFESLVAPLLEKTVTICRQALADAGVAPTEVSDVVLVGGSTRVPMVKRLVAELFGRTPNDALNPDEVVALGAAVQADVLAGERSDVLLLDVIPLSLGIETLGGAVSKLIPRNEKVPTSASELYTTYVDNQTAVVIHVVQGEREFVQDCRSLARFEVRIDPAPAGYPRVDVKFAVDASGVLHVTARDLRSGRVQEVEVKPSFGLSEAEIEQMLQDSMLHASEDRHARALLEARTESEPLIEATRRALATPAAEALVPDERELVDSAIEHLERAIAGNDPQAIRAAKDSLESTTRHLAELVMTLALDAAVTGTRIDKFMNP
ncbi:MAG TPA: Fe-S protein assembly chaperone HscA [Stenomitos sp.]